MGSNGSPGQPGIPGLKVGMMWVTRLRVYGITVTIYNYSDNFNYVDSVTSVFFILQTLACKNETLGKSSAFETC